MRVIIKVIMRTKNIFVGNQRVASILSPDENTVYTYYYHTDHLGSTTYLTDANRVLKEHIEYTPWGEGWIEEPTYRGDLPNYLFTGKELDATGLYYFGARYYDPRISMWMSPDPILAKYLDAVGKGDANLGVFNAKNLALYSYCHQNPMILVDPDGNLPVFVVPLAFAGGGALLGVAGAAMSDLMDDGKMDSGWQSYGGAAIGGAVGGLALMVAHPILAGAATGMVTDATTQMFNLASGKQDSINPEQIAINTGIGMTLGAIPGAGAGALKQGVTLGKGSMQAVANQIITKIEKGQIKNITLETLKKTIIGKAHQTSWVESTILDSCISSVLDEMTNDEVNK